MSGPVWAQFAIPAVAFVVLAVMIGGVYYADAHPRWRGQSAQPQGRSQDQELRERASAMAGHAGQRPHVRGQATPPEAGPEAGGGVPEPGGMTARPNRTG